MELGYMLDFEINSEVGVLEVPGAERLRQLVLLDVRPCTERLGDRCS
jgi:hypothetical protein